MWKVSVRGQSSWGKQGCEMQSLLFFAEFMPVGQASSAAEPPVQCPLSHLDFFQTIFI